MSIVMDTGSEWVKPLESTFLGLESGSCVAVNGGTIFHQKDLHLQWRDNLSSKRSSFVFWRWMKVIQVWNDTTWGQVINDKDFNFGVN